MLGFFPLTGAPLADDAAEIPSVNVLVTGVEATGFVGSVTTESGAGVFVAGVQASALVGNVDAEAGSDV